MISMQHLIYILFSGGKIWEDCIFEPAVFNYKTHLKHVELL